MKLIIWVLVGALIIFHQDWWFWEDTETYFGFLPVGLLYHMGVSVAAAIVWWLACTIAWPKGVDDFEDTDDSIKDGGAA